MRARELPGAVALGLLASLLAHEASFGGGHAMGGRYHDLLSAGCGLSAVAALVIAASVAWAAAGRTLDGSVLAARLRIGLPSWHVLALTSGAWLWLGERIEPHHDAVAPVLLAAAVALAAWVVRACVRAMLALLAAIVIAIHTNAFAPRLSAWQRISLQPAPHQRRLLRAQRRYARPPPRVLAGA